MNRILILLMLGLAGMQSITGCPTCLGRLELQSPTFFSEELYQLDPEDDIKSVYTYPGHQARQAMPDNGQGLEKETMNITTQDKKASERKNNEDN